MSGTVRGKSVFVTGAAHISARDFRLHAGNRVIANVADCVEGAAGLIGGSNAAV